MSKLIKIGLPSKGRLKDESLKIFKRKKLNVRDSKRNYLSEIKNFSLNEVVFSHAREIVERLADNSLDIGISGFDLLKESLPGIQKNIQFFSYLYLLMISLKLKYRLKILEYLHLLKLLDCLLLGLRR